MKSGGSFLFHGLGAALLVLFLSAVGGAYQTRYGAPDAGGGWMSGGGMQATGVIGLHTSGASESASHKHQEGYLALFGQPLLDAAPASLDFGTVAAGSAQVLAATLTNYGGVSLLLSNIALTSGDAEGAFTIEGPGASEVIAPGASAVWNVRFSPAGEGGARDTLAAETNDPLQPEWRLPLSGTGALSSPVIAWSPDSLEFGPLPLGEELALDLFVQNAGAGTLHVGPITTTDASFTVSPDSFALASGEEESLAVLFSPARAAVFRDTLWIPNNDPAESGSAPVVLTGSVPAELFVSKPEHGVLLFRATAGGEAPPEQRITIMNEGGEPLGWHAEAVSSGWLALEAESGSASRGEEIQIDVTADPAAVTVGVHEGLILLRDDAKPLVPPDTVRVSFIVDAFSIAVNRSEDVVPAGSGLTIDAYASLTPDSGRVYFRKVGEADYSSLAMQREGLKNLAVTIPGSHFDLRGIEYYVAVHAAANSVKKPLVPSEVPERVAVRVTDHPSTPVIGMHHTMISVPLSTGAARPSDVFPQDLGQYSPERWRLGRWSEPLLRYLEFPEEMGVSVDAGIGFWLIVRDGAIYSMTGLSTLPADGDTTFAIPLDGQAGGACWNQIGAPFAFPVLWEDCMIRAAEGRAVPVATAADSGLIDYALYAYRTDEEGSFYEESSLLSPWEGYFVDNLSGAPIELLVPAREAPAMKGAEVSTPQVAAGEWEISIVCGSEGALFDEVIVGARLGSREGWDRRDRHQPPPRPGAAARISIVPQGRTPAAGRLRADLRPPSEGVSLWSLSVEAPEGEDVLLAVTGGARLPDGCAAVLVDDAAGACRRLAEGFSYSFVSGGGSRGFRIAAGPEEALGAEGFRASPPARAFALAVPYPNPSRGASTVRFSLPRAGRAKLQVYNIAGRLVRVLADGERPAGDHVVEWDGRDQRGRASAPGIYFFRLEYENEVQTRRTVLFR